MVEEVAVEFGFSQITTILSTVAIIGGLLFTTARWLEQKADRKAERVKEIAEKTALDLKTIAEKTVSDTRIYSEKRYDELTQKVGSIDIKVVELLSDLRKRADLTNGNVALIRTEIADLQDDIAMIQDILPTNADTVKQSDMKKLRDRKRRNRRRDIEKDRVEQSERFLSRAD